MAKLSNVAALFAQKKKRGGLSKGLATGSSGKTLGNLPTARARMGAKSILPGGTRPKAKKKPQQRYASTLGGVGTGMGLGFALGGGLMPKGGPSDARKRRLGGARKRMGKGR